MMSELWSSSEQILSLGQQVGAVALAVPGVVRLEPSVVGGLRRLVRPGTVTDGVLLVRVGDRLEVTVDIAAIATRSAVATATEVEAAVDALVRAGHPGPVAVTVRVLAVESPGGESAGVESLGVESS